MIFGSRGFIGRHVADELSASHEVYRVSRAYGDRQAFNDLIADLLNQDDTYRIIQSIKPEVVINCAGVVNPNKNVDDNITYTVNIIKSLARAGLASSVIISGSAGSYGLLDNKLELPVSENTPLRASTGYALAKKNEEEVALRLSEELEIPVTALRIFNPIGTGMADKFLIPRVIRQIEDIKQGCRDAIEVSRLDSTRDYIAIEDVARAFRAVVEGDSPHNVYNIGSGIATSNESLLRLIIKSSKIEPEPRIIETQDQPEPLVASQADIRRMSLDFGWNPKESLSGVIERIVSEQAD